MHSTHSMPKIGYCTTYRGYEIFSVFAYHNGTYDFEVYPENDEHGHIEHKRTLEQVKASIDEILEEQNA